MKQSRNIPAVFGLPDEILEEIVAELDQHEDLISFALASRLCAALVIPHHTEYRILRVRHTLPNMWAHLARRADLARNVRQVHICEHHNRLSPDHYPNTLIDKTIDNGLKNAEESVRIRNICQALSHMHRLQVFTWSWKDVLEQRPTSHPYHENAVLTVVSRLPALEKLSLSGKFALHALGSHLDARSITYPVWKVANLTSLSLHGESWAKLANSKHLCHLLAKSPNLEYLHLPLEFNHLADCRFPKLKKLKLTLQAGALSVGIDNSRALFLQNHPTIEELNWFPMDMPHLGQDCLPNLRILCTNREFIASFNDPKSVPSSTGLLTPPATPVTAAPAPVPVQPNTTAPQTPRPVESLDVISLDAETLLELQCVDKKTLRKLKLHSFGSMSTLHELAAHFCNIEWLSLPSSCLPIDAVHPIALTKDDWLDLLPRFPNLRVFRGDGLWRAVNGEKQKLHEMIMEIARTCPHLRELDHCDLYDKYYAYKRITFKREGEEGENVSYSVTKPLPRHAFDVTDGTFD